MGERPGDRLGDNIIDYTIDEDKPEPSEEDNSTTEDTRARARRYPKRERQLNVMEGALYNSLQVWIARTDKIKTMYGSAGMEIIYELLDSDRFPLELVGYAIEKTVARNAMYETPLGYAAAYTEKLLFDWDERGFRTMEVVKRAKDDYT